MAERRVFSRTEVRMEVEVTFGGRHRKGLLHDVSVGGLFLEGEFDFQRDAECRVVIFLSDHRPPLEIPLCCSMVRPLTNGLAVRIESADPQTLARLRKLVLYNSEDSERFYEELETPAGVLELLKQLMPRTTRAWSSPNFSSLFGK